MTTAGLPPVLIERLVRDHARITGVVAQLSDTLAADETDWQRIGELIEFLDYYADRVHHPLEDRLFDHLVNKGLAPTERHLVFRNLGQHQEIISMTESLSATIAAALAGEVVDYDGFLERAAAFISLQQRHIRFEENYLFPLFEQTFENRDWNMLMGILDAADAEASNPPPAIP